MSSAPTQVLVDLVYQEARCIDEQRWDEWLAMYSDDAHYWMPLTHGQTDPLLQGSLMYEDKMLLGIRVERLQGRRTFSQEPISRCHHLLQAPSLEAWDAPQGLAQLRTAFHYVETRGDEQQLYAGWATHHLRRQGEAWRIVLKRVDLVNCDAAFGNIQLFM
jgi:3-phenylpropionate/cinnamic acid dioxygenase small subunit